MWSVMPVGHCRPPYGKLAPKKSTDCPIIKLLILGFLSTILIDETHAYKMSLVDVNTTYPSNVLLFPDQIKFIDRNAQLGNSDGVLIVSPAIINGVLIESCAPICLPNQKGTKLAQSIKNVNCIWRIIRSDLTANQLAELTVSHAELRCNSVWHRESRHRERFCRMTNNDHPLCIYDNVKGCELYLDIKSGDSRINKNIPQIKQTRNNGYFINYVYWSMQWSVLVVVLFLSYSAYTRCGFIGVILLLVCMVCGVISTEVRIVDAEKHVARFLLN